MTKYIEELWYGNISPITNFGINNAEMKSLIELIENISEKLEKTFNDTQKELFEKFGNCINEYMSVSEEQAFSDGFSLAVRLVTEAIHGTEMLN